MINTELLKKAGQRTIQMEVEAVNALSSRIDAQFIHACELILTCRGRTIVTGMGKSGLQQDCGHSGQYRHTRLLCSPR